MKKLLLSNELSPWMLALALLLLRCAVGLLLLTGHGWPKVQAFPHNQEGFPVPAPLAGWMNSTMSLGVTVFAEVVCCGLLVLGLATRLSAAMLVVVMAVAAFVIHGKDPLFFSPGMTGGFQELAVLYGVPAAFLVLTGGGGFSLDARFAKEKRRMFR